MVPVHYDTFVNGLDRPGDAARALRRAIREEGVAEGKVSVLGVGQQRVFLRQGEDPR
jgi:hypothetical protein